MNKDVDNAMDLTRRGEGPDITGKNYMLKRGEAQQKNSTHYREYLDRKIATGELSLTPQRRAVLEKFYDEFPLGMELRNMLGESVIMRPKDGASVEDYIHHFAVKRGRKADGTLF